MSTAPTPTSKHVLDPIDRISEILFGLIMVLTFTGSLSIADSGRDDIRAMLIGAIGCNIAWGIIDGVLYLMGCLAEKGRGLSTLRAVRKTTDPEEGQRLIAEALPSALTAVTLPADLEQMRVRLQQLPEPPSRASLSGDDWLGAVKVFFLVTVATSPVLIPFFFMANLQPAMRVSNGIAVVMMFMAGEAFGRLTGRKTGYVGVGMVLLGCALVAMTMALGG
jgi:VIT family